MKRLLTVLLAIAPLWLGEPASATHGGVWHWPSSNRHLEVVDILVHFIPVEKRDNWRQFRNAAFADWAQTTGIFTYEIGEQRNKKQKQWDGICAGTGASKATGTRDIMICRHGDGAAQAFPRYSLTCNTLDADYPQRCHLEAGALIALGEWYAGGHEVCQPNCAKYIRHELGHVLGIHAERFCPDISVMSYCDGSLVIDQHDRESVISTHAHGD